MSEGILNELYELVVGTCDSLYAARQLITTSAVKSALAAHGAWSEQELDVLLPKYINEWRLNTLSQTHDATSEISQCRAELQAANYKIKQLERQRLEIIQILRGILSA